jgi:hypothetical protein
MATTFTNSIQLLASNLACGARRQASRPLQYVGARLEHEYNEAALKAETLLWQTKVLAYLFSFLRFVVDKYTDNACRHTRKTVYLPNSSTTPVRSSMRSAKFSVAARTWMLWMQQHLRPRYVLL